MIQRDGRRVYAAYLDKALTRRVRRVPKVIALDAPDLKEMEDACRSLGLSFTTLPEARHPAAWWIDAGALEILSTTKSSTIKSLALAIKEIRDKKRSGGPVKK
jgi:signal recognition particle subunit SEC65